MIQSSHLFKLAAPRVAAQFALGAETAPSLQAGAAQATLCSVL